MWCFRKTPLYWKCTQEEEEQEGPSKISSLTDGKD